jgi:Flp pilus assembly pilin Flp
MHRLIGRCCRDERRAALVALISVVGVSPVTIPRQSVGNAFSAIAGAVAGI